jgi:hypothetical protein
MLIESAIFCGIMRRRAVTDTLSRNVGEQLSHDAA